MDVDETLIEEVRSRSILYDLGQADYKNLKKKEYAWREVAANVLLNGKLIVIIIFEIVIMYVILQKQNARNDGKGCVIPTKDAKECSRLLPAVVLKLRKRNGSTLRPCLFWTTSLVPGGK